MDLLGSRIMVEEAVRDILSVVDGLKVLDLTDQFPTVDYKGECDIIFKICLGIAPTCHNLRQVEETPWYSYINEHLAHLAPLTLIHDYLWNPLLHWQLCHSGQILCGWSPRYDDCCDGKPLTKRVTFLGAGILELRCGAEEELQTVVYAQRLTFRPLSDGMLFGVATDSPANENVPITLQ